MRLLRLVLELEITINISLYHILRVVQAKHNNGYDFSYYICTINTVTIDRFVSMQDIYYTLFFTEKNTVLRDTSLDLYDVEFLNLTNNTK